MQGDGRNAGDGGGEAPLFAALVALVLVGTAASGGWFALTGALLLLLFAFMRMENRRRRKHCDYLRCREGREDDSQLR